MRAIQDATAKVTQPSLALPGSNKHIFIADLSMTGHLNAKLIISSLEMEQHAFCAPQFIYIFGYIHVDK